MFKRALASLIVALVLLIGSSAVEAEHGLAIDGNLKYPENFKRFDYVSAQAEKKGELILHALGSFDKMNPFTLKGSAPEGLQRLVFETLTDSSLDEPFAQYGLLAKDVSVAKDGLSVTFVLDEKARFSDGSEVTSEDVKFDLYL